MIDITRMPYSDAAREYLLKAMGLSSGGRDEASQAAERGDIEGYYAAVKDGARPALIRGGQRMLAKLGIKNGETRDEDLLRAVLSNRDPKTGTQLGRKPAEQSSRDDLLRARAREAGDTLTEEEYRALARDVDRNGRRTPAAFYDVTVEPPKSFSVIESAAREAGHTELADEMVAAFQEAVAAVSDEVQRTAVYRTYSGGSKRARYHSAEDGMVTAAFVHATSREMDPHMHAHLAVSSQVVCPDGKVRAVDSAAFTPQKMLWDSIGMTTLAERLFERTGLVARTRADGITWELAGVDRDVIESLSKRSAQVRQATDQAVAAFRETHGREPSRSERSRIANVSAGATKRGKTKLSDEEQRALAWAGVEYDPDEIVRQALAAAEDVAEAWDALEVDEDAVVREALWRVQRQEASWHRSTLIDAVANLLPEQVIQKTVEATRLADAALTSGRFGVLQVTASDVSDVPDELRRDDDSRAVYVRPGMERYALADHVQTELRLLSSSAEQVEAQAWREAEVDRLIAQWRHERDAELERRLESYRRSHGEPDDDVRDKLEKGLPMVPWTDQHQALRALLGSTKRGTTFLAPAGTGKTAVMGFASRAWTADGRPVYGTATSDVAVAEMADAGVPECMNTMALVNRYGPDAAAAQPRTFERGAVLIVDEASMISAPHADAIRRIAERDGVQVVWTGDTEQYGAVGAGGAFTSLTRHNGVDAQMAEVVRFDNDWEAEASLRLRDGDDSVLAEYARQGRVHAGTSGHVADTVTRWVAGDMAAGKTAIVVTATNAEADMWNARVQAELQAQGLLDGDATVVGQAQSGTPVVTGARIQWRVPTDPGSVAGVYAADGARVKNREFLTVRGLDDQGSVVLAREDGTDVRVHPDVLAERAELGYSGTGHAVQGRTVDTCYATVPSYVAMTRGKHGNHLVLTTEQDADPDEGRVGRVATVGELTAEYQAARDAGLSTVDQMLEGLDESSSAATLTPAWEYGARLAASRTLDRVVAESPTGSAVLEGTPRDGDQWRRLCDALVQVEADGRDSEQILREVVTERTWTDARSAAAVLRWRVLRASAERAPTRAVSSWTERAAGFAERDAEVGRHVNTVAQMLDQRVATLGARAAQETPAWAVAALGPVPADERQQAEWITRAGRIALEREDRGVPDVAPSTGAAPHVDDVTSGMLWQDSRRAAGVSTDRLELENSPDSTLETSRARWRQARDAAPPDVDVQLAQVRIQRDELERQRALLRHAVETDPELDPDGSRAVSLDAQQEHAAARIEALERVAQVRSRYMDSVEATRAEAAEAERELKRRGRELGEDQLEPEQLELFVVPEQDTEVEDDAVERADLPREVETGLAEPEVEPTAAELELEDDTEAEREADEAQQEIPLDLPDAAPLDEPVGQPDLEDERHRGIADVLAVPDVLRRAEDEQQRLRAAVDYADHMDQRLDQRETEQAVTVQNELDEQRRRRDLDWAELERDRAAEREAEQERQHELEL